MLSRVVSTDKAGADSCLPVNARDYELVPARPLPHKEISVTLTLLAFGAKANNALIGWYSKHRVVLTHVSNTARIVSVVTWFLPLPISRALVAPLFLGAMTKLVCTLLMLSAPILRMLMSQYEFWFTTVLNTLAMAIFAIQIGPSIRLGYPLLTFTSIQVTICSDADVYSLSETARAGVLSSICATSLGLFALRQSALLRTLPDSTEKDWLLAELNFMSNVAITLAIFVINKSYKRRHVFWSHVTPYVPLAVCRAKLSVRSKQIMRAPTAESGQRGGESPSATVDLLAITGASASSSDGAAQSSGRESDDGHRSSCVLDRAQILQFRVVPLIKHTMDAKRTLWPALCLKRRLTAVQCALLVACGLGGLGLAIASLLLIAVADTDESDRILVCGVLSLLLTSAYCLCFAVHFQRDLCALLLRNFDFWFTSMQFVTATICLADLLDWGERCVAIFPWMLWFLWVLFSDALLPTAKRKLHFRKWHATPVLVAVVFNISTIAHALALDDRNILHSRAVELGSLGSFFSMAISTGTFMGYRLATIMLWTVRLAWRLAFRPEAELILLRGSVEFRNPFFRAAYSRASLTHQDLADK